MEDTMKARYACTLAAALLAGFAGCASHATIAEKNLEEGRLVPEEALATADFLNEYRHRLSPPRHAPAGLDIALERGSVLASGGKVLVQIGISTAIPALKPVSLHALVFAPSAPGKAELDQIGKALAAIRGQARGGALTVDLVQPVTGLAIGEPQLLPSTVDNNLKAFLAAFARRPFDEGEHHLILLVGTYKGSSDLQGLNSRERQDLVDLGRIISAKSVTLSVLSVGDKPDFAFLQKLGDTGHGTFTVATESLDYDAWITADLRNRSAETLSEIELTAAAGNGARLARVLAPQRLPSSSERARYALPELRQGEQRVLLAELDIPARGQDPAIEALTVELKYFALAVKRYYRTREIVAIQYVDDPNLALPRSNAAIERSLLILETQKTLQSVAGEIRGGRNYQAIALLTRQGRALKQTGRQFNDTELLRDAALIAKYADRLYDFDGEWLQTVKIWNDLSWDTSRFRNVYR
jgi:hypothetical protein